MNLSGRSFGRYHILEQLGQGGMAVVYKAYDTRLESEVAVKVIRTENILPSALERSLKRFEREAKALARLTHPNIVKVSDYGEHEGRPYLVMPYLPGGTLKQRLGQPMPWREAVSLVLPIAEALDYAHEQGMIHRDVKPSNILFTPRGQPMLTDFGIARIISDEETMDLTGTGLGLGTPEYMAPEQWTNQSVPQSDIYGLGVVLYELITGRKPYSADTPAALLLKQANDPLPRPGQFVAELLDEVEKVLLKALALKVDDRYADMAAFAGALEGLLERSGPVGMAENGEPRLVRMPEDVRTVDKKMAAPVVHTMESTPAQNWLVYWPWVGLVVLLGLALSVGNGLVSLGTQGSGPLAGLATSTPSLTPSLTPSQTATPSRTPTPTATATATLAAGATEVREEDGMVMVYVPAGPFEMGSDDWGPVHTVTLDGYWIDRTEVTNAMYRSCVDAGECSTPLNEVYYNNDDYADHPVVYVTWNDSSAYCEWAGVRLPTEAEWEKAARGTDGRIYPWGNGAPNCSLANYSNCGSSSKAVGSYPSGASPYGALDMAGNVMEWVADWYATDYYSVSPENNPQGPTTGEFRIQRGGAWFGYVSTLHSAYRNKTIPHGTHFYDGFRCARANFP